MMSEKPHRSTDAADWGVETELESYRTYCVTAFCGLGVSVLSLLAFAFPLMWLLPVVGVVVSAVALRRIAQQPDRLIGRRVALVGLAISLLIGIGAPTRMVTHRLVSLKQTQRFAEEWFTHLAAGQPHMALELTRDVKKRRALDERLWQQYRNNPNDAEALRKYVRDPLVATLLALGDSATVRHYETPQFSQIAIGDAVEHTFAVTYQEDGGPRSFFVTVAVSRDFEQYEDAISMRVFHAKGGDAPKQWLQGL